MFPVIIQIGPVIIYSLWFFAGIAFLASVFSFTHLVKLKQLDANFIYKHSLSIFLWGLVGSRIIFLARNYKLYFPEGIDSGSLLNIFFIWDKGLSLLGGILGIIIALIFYLYKEKQHIKRWLDITTISLLSGFIFGHFGSFLDGSAYGNDKNVIWGILFESPSIKYAVPIHPVQLYGIFFTIILTGILYYLFKNIKLKHGKITLIGIISYFTYLFLQGFIRGDDVIIFLGIREEQWLSIFMLLITGIYILYNYNKTRKPNKKEL